MKLEKVEVEEVNKFYDEYLSKPDVTFIHLDGAYGVGKTFFLKEKVFNENALSVDQKHELKRLDNSNGHIHIELWNDMYTAEPIEFIVRKFFKYEYCFLNAFIIIISFSFFINIFFKFFKYDFKLAPVIYIILFWIVMSFFIIFVALLALRLDFKSYIYLIISKIKFIEFNSSHELFAKSIARKMKKNNTTIIIIEDIDRVNNGALIATIQFLNLLNAEINELKVDNVKIILSYSDDVIFERNKISINEQYPTKISEELRKLNLKKFSIVNNNIEIICRFLSEEKIFSEYEVNLVRIIHAFFVKAQGADLLITYRNFQNDFMNIYKKHDMKNYSVIDIYIEFVFYTFLEIPANDFKQLTTKNIFIEKINKFLAPTFELYAVDQQDKILDIPHDEIYAFGDIAYSLRETINCEYNIYELLINNFLSDKGELLYVKPHFYKSIDGLKFELNGKYIYIHHNKKPSINEIIENNSNRINYLISDDFSLLSHFEDPTKYALNLLTNFIEFYFLIRTNEIQEVNCFDNYSAAFLNGKNNSHFNELLEEFKNRINIYISLSKKISYFSSDRIYGIQEEPRKWQFVNSQIGFTINSKFQSEYYEYNSNKKLRKVDVDYFSEHYRDEYINLILLRRELKKFYDFDKDSCQSSVVNEIMKIHNALKYCVDANNAEFKEHTSYEEFFNELNNICNQLSQTEIQKFFKIFS
jgi:hypothetical protein